MRSLAPDLGIFAPARVWGLSRDDCVELAAKWEIPITVTKEKPYSIDDNLWGKAIECGAIEDPWAPAPDDVYTLTHVSETETVEVVVGFESGVPVSLDGTALAPAELIGALGALAGSVASVASTWWRTAGSGSRAARSTSARRRWRSSWPMPTWRTSRSSVTCTTRRPGSSPAGAELVYDGLWYSPLRVALQAFITESQRHVTGEVRLRFAPPGTCTVVGRRSPVALYDHGLATYDASDSFRHVDAEGFVRLWGLGVADVVGPPGPRRPAPRRGSAMTLWEGRISAGMADAVAEFTVSLPFDQVLATTTWRARAPTSRDSARSAS